jgi:gas vesicle protein
MNNFHINNYKMTTTEKVLIGTLTGLVVGAISGILFAPDKGTETRKKISQKSNDTISGIKEKLEDLMNLVNEKVNLAAAEMKDVEENFKSDGERIKKDIRTTSN